MHTLQTKRAKKIEMESDERERTILFFQRWKKLLWTNFQALNMEFVEFPFFHPPFSFLIIRFHIYCPSDYFHNHISNSITKHLTNFNWFTAWSEEGMKSTLFFFRCAEVLHWMFGKRSDIGKMYNTKLWEQ